MQRSVKRVAIFLIVVLSVALLAAPAAASENFAILGLEQRGANYVFLEWAEYAGADGYSVYRCENGGSFGLIKNVASCSTYNYALQNGKTYTYFVRPYSMLDDGRKHYLAESEHASIQIGVKTPENLEVRPYGKASAEISWTGDPLADCYLIYRSTDNRSWTLVKSVSGVRTITYGLDEGSTYYFRVKAARRIQDVLRYSGYSDPIQCTLGIDAPGYLTIKSVGAHFVEMEWEAVPGATGYRLYRAEDDGAYQLVKTVQGTTTKNYNLHSDVTYTYRIAAIMEGTAYTFKSAYTDSQPIRLALGAVENLRVEQSYSNGVRLAWDPAEGASAYRLYRTGEDGTTTLVKTIAECETNTYSLEAGRCYRFSVKPICISGDVTVNGETSGDLRVFFTENLRLTALQDTVNRIRLSWNAVSGAEAYRVIIQQGADPETAMELTGTKAEYELNNSGAVTISLWAVRDGIASVGVVKQLMPVYEKAQSFAIAEAIDETRISLAWEAEDHAIQYEVQRFDAEQNDFVTIALCEDTSLVDRDVLANTAYQYRYRVQYDNADTVFWGNWSETVSIMTPGAPKYRALLIGEENYDTVLHGPINDIEAMNQMLSGMTAMDWEIYRQADATRDEILALISLAFMDASENDVSLFYYSGHGVTGSGDSYSGALVAVDYNYLPMGELAELLSLVPGKVIVVLDSCGSGAAISGEGESRSVTQAFDPESFNTQVVEIFTQYNALEQDKSAEFATDKFWVLTSSAYEQNSRSICIDNVWGGVFTRAFVGSVGYDYNSKHWDDSMRADKNADDCVTLDECYEYCCSEASAYQDVQVYPLDSSAKLFYR